MNNEELIKHFKGILTGTSSEQDTVNFTQILMQIAKEGYGERKHNPVYEALETLDDLLEELDEFYGLVTLPYCTEAYKAMEVLHSWHNKQSDKDEAIEYLLDMLEEEHMGMRAVAVKKIKDVFDIEI